MTSTQILITSVVTLGPNYYYKPTDNSEIVSYEMREIFDIVNYVILSGAICLFGMVSNVINIVIFLKQGLNTTINISLFSLAISDFLSVSTLQFTNFCANPLFIKSGVPWDPPLVQYLVGGWSHSCFAYIGSWITAYLTAERCLCIAMPLKVKQILTPLRTSMIMIFLYSMNIAYVIPEYCYAYIGWNFYPERNVSLLSVVYRKDMSHLEGISFIAAAIIGALSYPFVIVFTTILVISLNRQAKWRSQTAKSTQNSDTMSKRDFKTMRMIVLLASVLIVCYGPGSIGLAAVYIVPGLSITGPQTNLFFVVWSFGLMFQGINSTVNIFMYYNMSTKYKKTFQGMFKCCVNKTSSTPRSSHTED